MTTKLALLNSTLSMKAMCVRQAIEALRAELKPTPAECIAIEKEMATRLHRNPALAHAKFAKMVEDIAVITPWFETFLKLLQAGEIIERAVTSGQLVRTVDPDTGKTLLREPDPDHEPAKAGK
jgi:hypothetical protein